MNPHAPFGVFIVDDLPLMQERLRELLATIEGVEVVGDAQTTDAAIAGILGTSPDAVVLDYQLADATGVKVLRVVGAAAPEIAFIVLTNHATPQHRAACLDAGARYFFDKSTEFGKIPGAIAEIGAGLH
ncbi:MAG TPA: response regulator transcription factor [Casimicrobiaceae bacterium]|jgi:DNA-binding NarL/FixJ family response regulator